MIDRGGAVELLRSMVLIPSFSGDESKLGLHLSGLLSDLGFQTAVDGTGNLIAEIGDRSGPQVVLLGHMDTVRNLFPVREEAGMLYGRGTVDAKGPLAAFVCAAAQCGDLPLRLTVIGAVDEENGSAGAIGIRRRYEPSAVFIGEPSGADGLVIGYKGQIKGRFVATEAMSHGAGPSRGAAATAFAFWQELQQLCVAWSSGKSAFDAVTPTIIKVQGEREFAVLEFDIRLPEQFPIDAVLGSTQHWNSCGSLWFGEHFPAIVHPKNSPPAISLRAAIRSSGLQPRLKVKTGTCDMNTVAGYWKAPCVAYGPGDSDLDHTSNEHISLDEYWSSISILKDALGRLSRQLTALGSPNLDRLCDD